MERTFMMNQSDIKRQEENRKLTLGEGAEYTTGCLLEKKFIKNRKN